MTVLITGSQVQNQYKIFGFCASQTPPGTLCLGTPRTAGLVLAIRRVGRSQAVGCGDPVTLHRSRARRAVCAVAATAERGERPPLHCQPGRRWPPCGRVLRQRLLRGAGQCLPLVFPFDNPSVHAGLRGGSRYASGGGPGRTISATVGDILCAARVHARPPKPRALPSALRAPRCHLRA